VSVRLLAFGASLKKASINRKLILLAAEAARKAGAEVDLAEFAEFEAPMFNADLEVAGQFPEGVLEFQRRVVPADGLLISSPEYNYSLPGTLKNLIDWASRLKPMPLKGKSALLLATSGGTIGGIRGLWQLRIPLEGLGVFVLPDMYILPSGREAFEEHGALKEAARQERLEKIVTAFLDMAERLRR
jgi:NAD(P)H-dependent FMN reductase